jgi:NTE family protein
MDTNVVSCSPGKTCGSPCLGIALGGGAARGLSHIGVLRALDDIGIRPSVLAGSSIGALVAAASACGSLQALERMAASLRLVDLMRFADIYLRGGILKGDSVCWALRQIIGDVTFEDLATQGIILVIVAADLHTGERVFIREGTVADAVRASISVPGLFAPVVWNNRTLVDGGLVDLMPVDALVEAGADVTVGVDVFSERDIWTKTATRARVSVTSFRRSWTRVVSFVEKETNHRLERAENLAREVLLEHLGARKGYFHDLFRSMTSDTAAQDSETTSSLTKDAAGSTGNENSWSTVKAVLAAFDITSNLLQEPRIGPQADIVVRPNVSSYHGHQFYLADRIISEGYKAAMTAADDITRLLARRGE